MKGEGEQRIVQYGFTQIKYTLIQKDRKKLAIHVQPDAQVVVEAPISSAVEDVDGKVHKRGAWILKQQRVFKRYAYELPPRDYVSGETHRYLGKQYRLKVLRATNGGEMVKMDRGRIMIYTKASENRERKKKLLDDWYRRQAKRVYAERLLHWFPHFQRFEIDQPKLQIRKMKSQWGSCSPAGKITINLKLIQVPKHLIDYALVHELSHLIELNHTDEFYILIQRVMPDWEERKEKLNRFEF